jgi:hypothetical protein
MTGDPSAIIPGSNLTEAEFGDLSTEEQKRQRRLIRNRLSAQMHRQRQRAHIDALEAQVCAEWYQSSWVHNCGLMFGTCR